MNRRQRKIIEDAFQDKTLFEKLATKIKKNLDELVDSSVQLVESCVTEMMRDITHDIAVALGDHAADLSCVLQQTGELRKQLDEIRSDTRLFGALDTQPSSAIIGL